MDIPDLPSLRNFPLSRPLLDLGTARGLGWRQGCCRMHGKPRGTPCSVTQGSPNCLGHMRVRTHTQAWLPVGKKGLEASASALFLCVPAHDSKDARKPSGSKRSRDAVPFEHSSSCRVSAWPCPDVRNVPLSWEHLHLSPFLVSLYHSPHPLRSSLPDSVTTSSKSYNVTKVLKRKGKPGTSQALVIVLSWAHLPLAWLACPPSPLAPSPISAPFIPSSPVIWGCFYQQPIFLLHKGILCHRSFQMLSIWKILRSEGICSPNALR